MAIFSSLYGERLSRELGNADMTELFTTARRKAAINEAQAELADLTHCLVRISTVTLTGGQAEYNLLSTTVLQGGDFVRFADEQVTVRYTDASSNVTLLSGDDLPRRDAPWLNRYEPGWQVSTVASTTMQLPSVYYDRKDGGAHLLGFWPTPSTGSSASMVAVVPYEARPATLTNDTDEPFTVNSSVRSDLRWMHQALVHYAASQLEKFRRDDSASERQLQKFMGYIARFWQERRGKNGNALTFARNYLTRKGAQDAKDPRT